MKKIILFFASFLSIAFASHPTFAATVSARQGLNGAFVVSSIDLAENAIFTQTEGTAMFGSTLDALHDGLTYNGIAPDYTENVTFTPSDGSVILITFDLTTNPEGYAIDTIVTLTGTGNSQFRSAQNFTLAYSTVSQPTIFNSIELDPAIDGTTDFLTDNVDGGYQEVQIRISGLGLSNVAALQFTFTDAGTDGQAMYREIDVYDGELATLAVAGTKQLVNEGIPDEWPNVLYINQSHPFDFWWKRGNTGGGGAFSLLGGHIRGNGNTLGGGSRRAGRIHHPCHRDDTPGRGGLD